MGTADNYKHLYEQTKKMLTMYQDELIPGFRQKIEELEKNQINVHCKECVHMKEKFNARFCEVWCMFNGMGDEGFCNYGERED